MRLKRFIFSLVAVLGFVQATPAAASDDDQPDMEFVEKNVDAFPGSIYADPLFTTTTTFGTAPVWYRNPIKWATFKWKLLRHPRKGRA